MCFHVGHSTRITFFFVIWKEAGWYHHRLVSFRLPGSPLSTCRTPSAVNPHSLLSLIKKNRYQIKSNWSSAISTPFFSSSTPLFGYKKVTWLK
jgi:hypothetical protein